ncbi:hypothetical protein BH09PAT3_BH09PAT3_1690 [soil metagenome]
MYSADYEAIRDSLPVKHHLDREVLRADSKRSFSFDVLKDNGKPVAVVREYIHAKGKYSHGELPDSVRALNLLQSAGVEVAPFLPVKVAPKVDLLVVPYMEGPDLDIDDSSVAPKQLLAHASALGNYLVQATYTEKFVLNDFVAPNQYKVQDGKPVLVDIDGYVDPTEEHSPALTRHYLDEISGLYSPMLPQAEADQLKSHTAALIQTV